MIEDSKLNPLKLKPGLVIKDLDLQYIPKNVALPEEVDIASVGVLASDLRKAADHYDELVKRVKRDTRNIIADFLTWLDRNDMCVSVLETERGIDNYPDYVLYDVKDRGYRGHSLADIFVGGYPIDNGPPEWG